ncbi:MAG TPA: universal stress protein [Bacteroidia bacterium]|nr:universal stress protein [Bacteroidia bacterium]
MDNILVAVDFSSTSKNAVGYAANLADYFGAKLTLFHAYHVSGLGFDAGYIPPIEDMTTGIEEEMKKFEGWLKYTYPDITVDHCIEMGLAADTIESVANEKQADLIVVGLSGQNDAIKEHVFGSIAARVAETSKIPVLVIPEHVRYSPIKKIAYACDLDKHLETNDCLMKVKYFCSLFDAELQVLNVIKPEEEMSMEKANTDSYLEEKFYTTKHDTFFIYDEKVDKGLVQFLDHHESDLLITCPKTHNFFHDLFIESNTKKLVFHSPVPILTLHE